MRDPTYRPREAAARGMDLRPPGAEAAELDITRDTKLFAAAIRTRVFTFLRAWSIGDGAAAIAALTTSDDGDGALWTPDRLKTAMDAYKLEHQLLRLDPEARNLRHTHVSPSNEQQTWRVEQMLVDPEMINDWVAEFEVDVAASRETQEPVIRLVRIGSVA
jgi:hypothetical protein